eukprot:gene20428-22441_t
MFHNGRDSTSNNSKKIRLSAFIILVVTFLCHVDAQAVDTAQCKTYIIASTLGTFVACLLFAVAAVLLARQRLKQLIVRGLLRKNDLEGSKPADDIQFENPTAIAQDDGDSGFASPISASAIPSDVQPAVQVLRQAPIDTTKDNSHTPSTTTDAGTQTCDFPPSKPKQSSVVVEKRANGSLGLNFAIAGVYVKSVDHDVTNKQIESVEPGDEVISIDGTQVEGMTDMEVLTIVAKSGPTVQLQIVKHAFLWKVDEGNFGNQQMKKQAHSPQLSTAVDYEALKKAKLEIGEALMELRRCTSQNSKTAHPLCVKLHEKSSSQHSSFIDSIELQHAIHEEEFVVIEGPESTPPRQVEIALDSEKIDGGNDMEINAMNVSVSACQTTNAVPVIKASKNENVTALKLDSDSAASPEKKIIIEHKSVVSVPVCDSNCDLGRDSKAGKVVQSGSGGPINQNQIAIESSSRPDDVKPNRQMLHLPLKNNIYQRPKRASPPEEPQAFHAMNGNSHAGSPVDGSNIQNMHSPAGYYVTENATTNGFYPAQENVSDMNYVCADLDKIKPPPSYEVASLTFNTQKPGSKSYSGGSSFGSFEHKITIGNQESSPVGTSIHNSTDSSFDDLDPAIYFSKSNRDAIDIDEHVMRYMTKKYSEPRFPISASLSSSPPSATGQLSQSLPAPRFAHADYSISQPRSASEYPDAMQPALNNDYHRAILSDIPNNNGAYVIASNSSLHHQSEVVDSMSCGGAGLSRLYKDDAQRSCSAAYFNDRELVNGRDLLLMSTTNGSAQYPSRRLSPEHAPHSMTDLYKDLTSSLELTPTTTSPESVQDSATMSKLKLGAYKRLLKQRYPFQYDLAKNIRRAASSPSVNAEHQRGESSESSYYNNNSNDSLSVQKRNQRNQRNRGKSRAESFDRRKSIDSGSLRKLAAELQANQSLSDDLPMLARLLGGAGGMELAESERGNNLYRYNSSDTLY